eukprot:2737390-Ditylum_brightwellii.AAC.1
MVQQGHQDSSLDTIATPGSASTPNVGSSKVGYNPKSNSGHNGIIGQIFSQPTTLYVKRKADDNDINLAGNKKQKPDNKKKWPADNEVVEKGRLQRKRAGSRKLAKER